MTRTTTILPNEKTQGSSTKRQHGLTADDSIGLEKVKNYYALETQKCVASPNVHELTEHEYRFATPDFKELIEIPKNKKEPIYIAAEKLADNTFNPQLQAIINGITSGKPYHSFINRSLGETWPLLLRLLYGLENKFRISMEQFHSMLKVNYWLDSDFEVKNTPLFEKNQFTEAGKILVNNALFVPEQEKQKKQFITAMSDTTVPAGERMLQVVTLPPQYFRVAMMASQTNPYYENSPLISIIDSKENVPTLGVYSQRKTLEFAKQHGAEILMSALQLGHIYHRLFFVAKKPVLLLPSQTMIEKYIHLLNPSRKIKVARRIGPFGPTIMEQHSDKNERVINLFAPGITNPLVTHGQVIFPWAGMEHDEYHVLYEGQLSKVNYDQLSQAKKVLHNILGENAKVITSEIFRAIDRERAPVLGEERLFLELVKYLFANDLHNYNSELKLSSFILLADMILSPEHWPYYEKTKQQLIPALLHANNSDTQVITQDVEVAVRDFGKKTANDIALTSILLLCRYYLHDPLLCVALLYLTKKVPAHAAPYGWHKSKEGDLNPTLTINNKEYHFAELQSSTCRANLVLNAKFPGKQANASEFVIVRIPEVDEDKFKAIASAGGIILEPADQDNIAVMSIQAVALDKALREKLKLSKIALTFPSDNAEVRCNYLATEGITVEKTETTNKFMFTLFKTQLPIVEAVKNNWRKLAFKN